MLLCVIHIRNIENIKKFPHSSYNPISYFICAHTAHARLGTFPPASPRPPRRCATYYFGGNSGEGERHPANVYMMVVICSNLNNIFFLLFFDSTLFCIFFFRCWHSIRERFITTFAISYWCGWWSFFLSYIFLILLCVATCGIWGNLAALFSMFIGDFVNYILIWENRIGG